MSDPEIIWREEVRPIRLMAICGARIADDPDAHSPKWTTCAGQMNSTGSGYTKGMLPTMWLHRCTHCGREEHYEARYPRVEFVSKGQTLSEDPVRDVAGNCPQKVWNPHLGPCICGGTRHPAKRR